MYAIILSPQEILCSPFFSIITFRCLFYIALNFFLKENEISWSLSAIYKSKKVLAYNFLSTLLCVILHLIIILCFVASDRLSA